MGKKNEENRPQEAVDDFNQPIARLSVVIDQSNLPLLEMFELSCCKSTTLYSELTDPLFQAVTMLRVEGMVRKFYYSAETGIILGRWQWIASLNMTWTLIKIRKCSLFWNSGCFTYISQPGSGLLLWPRPWLRPFTRIWFFPKSWLSCKGHYVKNLTMLSQITIWDWWSEELDYSLHINDIDLFSNQSIYSQIFRILDWCADLAPSRLLQLIQVQLCVGSPAYWKTSHSSRVESLID